MKPIPMERMVNHDALVMRGAWPPAARAAAACIAAAALALVAGACGSPLSTSTGRPPTTRAPAISSSAGGSASTQLLAFSRCVRSHGVANFPDPQAGASNAKFPSAQQLQVSNRQLSRAETVCQRLLPVGTDDQFAPAEVPLLLRSMLPFASCMRSHGVPDFPDPAVDSEGRPVFSLSTHGISLSYSHSQQFSTVVGECQHLLPRQLGGIPFG